MAIRVITEKNIWDQFIDASPDGLLYHKWDFLKLIEKYSKYSLLPYGISKGERLVAVFPLFYKRVYGVKCIFSPPPQSGVPYLGFVMDKEYFNSKQDRKESEIRLVAQEINDEIEKISPSYIAISLVPGFTDVRPFKWFKYAIAINYTYTLELDRSLDEIWASFNSTCRQNIKKGESCNLRLVKSQDVSVLIELLKERYNQQAMNYLVNPEYLAELIQTYPENLGVYQLLNNDEVIGVTLNHEYKRFLGWMGLTKAKDAKYKYANESMIWSFVQQAKLQEYPKLEISGANNPNLCQYRAKFNPQTEICLELSKKSLVGKVAEYMYRNYIKKI